MNKGFEVGMKVRHKKENRLGVVVPDAVGLCGQNHLMVDLDGVSGDQAYLASDLEALEKIQVVFSPEKCKGCVFANHCSCNRYSEARAGWLFSGQGGKKWSPQRMYPFCQDGHG